jgi:uncharacterized membrane protein YczE
VNSVRVDPPRSDASVVAWPPPWVVRGSGRLGLLVSGSLIMAVGVAVLLWSGLGPGPLDVFIGAIRERTGLSLTLSLWLVIASVIGAAWAIGRRPGPGTLVAPLIIGPSMQAALSVLDGAEPPDSLALLLMIHVAAVFVVGLGAGGLIVSGLGAGSGELLASAASDRSGRPEPGVRMVFELTWLVAGVALGGPTGIGTVVVALVIGPAVAIGHRAVEAAAVSCRSWPAATCRRPVAALAGGMARYCDGKQ